MSEELSVNCTVSTDSHLVFLHGWGQNKESLEPLAKFFKNKYTIHLIDLPGFGNSERPKETWGTHEYAARIAQYLRDNNLNKASFIGHSFGGKVLLELALCYPELIDKIVLIAASGLKPKRSFKNSFYLSSLMLLGKIVRCCDFFLKCKLYENYFIPNFAGADYRANSNMRDILVRVLSENYDNKISKIKAPIQLIWGDRDTETPLYMGLKFKSLLENSRLAVLKGKDHFSFKGVGSHLCAYHIRKFLEQ